jgi:hypothetical protein
MGAHVALFLMLAGPLAGDDYLPFPPSQPKDLIGHSPCELPPESEIGRFVMPIARSRYRLEYRKRYQIEMVLLVEGPENCRSRIVGVLQLPIHGDDEAVNFDCHPLGQAVREGEFFIGISPSARRAKATPAWRIDLTRKGFELVQQLAVECESGGVD